MIKDAGNVQLTPDEARLFTAEFYFELPQNETGLPEGMVKKLVDDVSRFFYTRVKFEQNKKKVVTNSS